MSVNQNPGYFSRYFISEAGKGINFQGGSYTDQKISLVTVTGFQAKEWLTDIYPQDIYPWDIYLLVKLPLGKSAGTVLDFTPLLSNFKRTQN